MHNYISGRSNVVEKWGRAHGNRKIGVASLDEGR